jgi:hypothetical protein
VRAAAAPRPSHGRNRTTDEIDSNIVWETIAVSVTLCGIVPALLPLLQAGMPATHDGFLHVQRTIAIDEMLRAGSSFSRWVPDLAFEYGQPLFLYYAPFSYVPAALLRLAGAGYVTSFELTTALALVLSGLAMYACARSLLGRLASVAAALVYALLPYQLIDIYVRGALAESWAFVWLPLSALCLTRACAGGHSGWCIGLALGVAALVLTHNVTALLFLPALLLLVPLLAVQSTSERLRRLWRPLAAIALGLLLSAWFWVPALAERHLVQIAETIEPRLFSSFFVDTWPPFRPEPLFDYRWPVSTALGTPIFWPQLGLIQVLVSAVGAGAVVKTSGIVRCIGIWAVLLVLVGFAMQLRALAPIYDLIPLLAFAQFPWRLLAIVGLGSALLAGVAVEALSGRTSIRALFAVAIVGASSLTALAQLQPEASPVDERSLSTATIVRLELAEYGLGSTHSGEYLPVSSGQRNANRFRKTLIDAASAQPDSATTRPSNMVIHQIDWRPDRIRTEVSAPTPDRLVVHQFAFPGWSAAIDGRPTEPVATGPLGLLGVDVPAGRHTVEISLRWTPLRLATAVGSSIGLLLLIPVLGATGRWHRNPRAQAGAGTFAIIVMAVAFVPGANPTVEAGAGTVNPQVVSESLAMVGGHLDTSRLANDRLVIARLVWQARSTTTTGYRAHLEVTTPDGRIVGAPWSYEPLSRLWERNEVVPTTAVLRVSDTSPGGSATVRLVFDEPARLAPIDLGVVELPTPLSVVGEMGSTDGVTVGDGVRLSAPAFRPDGVQVRAGDSLDVPLQWELTGSAPDLKRELIALAVLTAHRGEIVSEPRRPGDWFAPLPFWQPGETVDQSVRLSLPARISAGDYPLVVRVYLRDLATGGVSEPGASSARPRGLPVAELPLGTVTVVP